MLNNWQRIEKIVKWSGASSVNAFAREIGLNRSENLYQIKRGNNGISRELADIIAVKYPQLSKAWVLTGQGEMLVEDDLNASKFVIPFYNLDAISLLTSDEPVKPQYKLSLPLFEGCDFAAMHYGDAMYPEIVNGSVVLCREIDSSAITPGEVYLVMSGGFCGVRRIRREPFSRQLRLVAANRERFDDILIESGAVKKLYHIAGVIIKTI